MFPKYREIIAVAALCCFTVAFPTADMAAANHKQLEKRAYPEIALYDQRDNTQCKGIPTGTNVRCGCATIGPEWLQYSLQGGSDGYFDEWSGEGCTGESQAVAKGCYQNFGTVYIYITCITTGDRVQSKENNVTIY